MSRSQLGPFLGAVHAHPRFEVVAIVDSARRPFRPLEDRLRRAAIEAFNPAKQRPLPRFSSLARIAADANLPLTVPAGRDINHPDFLREVRTRWRADVAISLGCIQIFRPALLNCFEQAVNLHNGLLPDYRGLSATGWSLYRGERRSGYSYHRITPGIDAGAVLAEGALDVDESSWLAEVETRKLQGAADLAPRVLDAVDRKEVGREQSPGEGLYFSRHDSQRIRTIKRSEELSRAEILRRLRCFGLLRVRLREREWEVTGLADQGGVRFSCADGSLGVTRAAFLPPAIYRVWRAL